MVDTMIVGRFVSTQALAGVGSTGAISFLIMGFAMGVTSGFSVVISQRFGANDEKGLRSAVAMSVYLCVALTVVMTLVSTLATRPLLMLMNTPDDMFADAYQYIFTIFAGMAAPIFTTCSRASCGRWGQPYPFVFSDSLLGAERRAGPAVHPQLPHGG